MAERGKGFPRISLSSAIQIIEAAQKFGKSWTKEQFAGFGAKGNAGSHKSGAFMARLSALREYGLITTDREGVAATALAQAIAKPISEDEREKSIKRAFLSVSTFSQVYDSLDSGTALPRDKFAGYAVTELGVSRDSMDKFVNVFIDSGTYTGLVNYNKESKDITLVKGKTGDVEGSSQPAQIATADNMTNEDSLSLLTPRPTAVEQSGDLSTAMNEQGVNHAGDGWVLTVLVKSGHRLTAELRLQIRDLLDAADNVADKFYENESKRGE